MPTDDEDDATTRTLPSARGWWRDRGTVERVELYTIGSLYVLYWFLALLWALSAAAGAATAPAVVGILGGVLVLGGIGTVVLRGSVRHRFAGAPPPWGATVALGVAAVPLTAAALLLPEDVRSEPALLVVGTLAWCAGGLPGRAVVPVLAAVSALVPLVLSGGQLSAALGGVVMGLFFVFTVQSSFWLLEVVTELDRARDTRAALAVAEERLRFSRDVHDVLGRRLSTIAVQAELAATLSARGDDRATGEILAVRETAHEGLREARELARGYRPLDLDQELDGAVSLLRSAGIAATVTVDGLPAAWHEPAARVVREAVTNVLRHSDARDVSIRWDGRALVVANDGVLDDDVDDVDDRAGTGLRSLAEHLEPTGGSLDARRDGQHFLVTVTFSTPAEVGA